MDLTTNIYDVKIGVVIFKIVSLCVEEVYVRLHHTCDGNIPFMVTTLYTVLHHTQLAVSVYVCSHSCIAIVRFVRFTPLMVTKKGELWR